MPLRGVPLTLCLLATLATSTGCRSVGDYQSQWAMKCRMHESYKVAGSPPSGWEPARHYERGWKTGYADVASGSDGCAPAVPPHCYWSFKYQNAEGQVAVQTWFQGYEDRALAAKNEGVQQYNYLPSPYRSTPSLENAMAPPEYETSASSVSPATENVADPPTMRLPAVEEELPTPAASRESAKPDSPRSPFEGALLP